MDFSNEILLLLNDKLEKYRSEIQVIKGDRGEKGAKGDTGAKGERGAKGDTGAKGERGADGKDGKDGRDGISVTNVTIDFDKHLVLQLSDGSELDCGEISVSGTEGDSIYQQHSSSSAVRYTSVTSGYDINPSTLSVGHNIFGVSDGGTINLPNEAPNGVLIVIKNESGTTLNVYPEKNYLDINSAGDDLLINATDQLIISFQSTIDTPTLNSGESVTLYYSNGSWFSI